jgi:hypothetical protein
MQATAARRTTQASTTPPTSWASSFTVARWAFVVMGKVSLRLHE